MNWQDLHDMRRATRGRRIMNLFETPNRAKEFSVKGCDMLLDYSKTNIDTKTRWKLLQMAEESGLSKMREAMFTGEKINDTEGRAVLHTALRNLDGSVMVDGKDVMPGVRETLNRMEGYALQVRAGEITDVVNIGIGGSDLGPAMAYQALSPYRDGPRCHFVSNVDGAHIQDVLDGLDARTTLVIVASKTFTTIETMTNAKTARAWMDKYIASPGAQFAALSSNLEKTGEFGIAPERVFGFEDWVGGRYSVWGPIGLSLMLAIGPERFREFLAGAAAMDAHFREATDAQNMPLMLALVGIWHNQICGYSTRAVLPYEQRLARLPAYLQQLEMESNGKRVDMEGHDLSRDSGPVVWGEPGTNGQHAFYQLIHQGTRVIPCEFLVAREGHEPHLDHQHRLLVGNCLAQSEALLKGRSLDKARAQLAERFSGAELERQARHRVFTGNRPSTTLAFPKLTPRILGAIIALYEHRVFAEGVLLGINSFDQWGVELGKELAVAIDPLLQGAPVKGKDGSTTQLIKYMTHSK